MATRTLVSLPPLVRNATDPMNRGPILFCESDASLLRMRHHSEPALDNTESHLHTEN